MLSTLYPYTSYHGVSACPRRARHDLYRHARAPSRRTHCRNRPHVQLYFGNGGGQLCRAGRPHRHTRGCKSPNTRRLGPPPPPTYTRQSCIAVVYTVITYILYWDSMLPLLISTAADGLCLVAVVVVACVVGKPVSYLSCPALPGKGNTANFVHSLFANLGRTNGVFEWVDPDKATCFEIKAIWGLSICLCVMYFMSAMCSACLWQRIKGGSHNDHRFREPEPAPQDKELA